MTRSDGRTATEQRPVSIELGFQRYPEGSALIKVGNTWVLCAASVIDGVPPFISEPDTGWVTAEYAMLPRSTHTRSGRSPGGRGKEIQRLIGRALRGAFDLGALGERTITVDCDVLQADGGTRCASITGAWVAAAVAARKLEADGQIRSAEAFCGEPIAAVSVGIVDGEARLDLHYEEDSRAQVDMNVVMSESAKLLEIQGTAEHFAFTRTQLDELVDLAQAGSAELCALQRRVLSEAA